MIILKTAHEIELMAAAGQVVAAVFEALEQAIQPGISTWEVDQIVWQVITSHGATPSFLNYGTPPFPASSCVSINEEVVHGIPAKERLLAEGDIVSVDVGANLDGFHGDACRTYCVGEVDPQLKQLIEVTEQSFWQGVAQAFPSKRLGDISHAVQSYCESFGYGVVRDLTGHGIGRSLHEAPDLLNYGKSGRGIRLEAGMTLALEPMITIGSYQIELLSDQWTIVTADRQAAAHYENTFAITEKGPRILTLTTADRLRHADLLAQLESDTAVNA